MKKVETNFESMVEHVNKISSLKLENREEAVIMAMLNSGIGASANGTIEKLSNALNTTKTNNFRARQEEETLFGPSFNAERFNFLNKDIEAILESGYNARIIDQTINVANMINGKNVTKTKGEVVLHTLDNMNIKNPEQTMSYSDFDAKYNNAESKTVVDQDLPAETVEEIRRDACLIFQAVNGRGLSRVDFFVEKGTGEVVFNDINTFPGFTSISMYPMLWKNQGYTIETLVDELIELGFNR